MLLGIANNWKSTAWRLSKAAHCSAKKCSALRSAQTCLHWLASNFWFDLASGSWFRVFPSWSRIILCPISFCWTRLISFICYVDSQGCLILISATCIAFICRGRWSMRMFDCKQQDLKNSCYSTSWQIQIGLVPAELWVLRKAHVEDCLLREKFGWYYSSHPCLTECGTSWIKLEAHHSEILVQSKWPTCQAIGTEQSRLEERLHILDSSFRGDSICMKSGPRTHGHCILMQRAASTNTFAREDMHEHFGQSSFNLAL